MNLRTYEPKRGAALLISVLVLTTILVGFAAIGARTFINETQSLSSLANKKRAEALAAACMDEALYRLGTNASYTGSETITLGSEVCTIRPVSSGGGIWTLETEAMVGSLPGRLRATLSSRSPIIITSWNSVPSF